MVYSHKTVAMRLLHISINVIATVCLDHSYQLLAVATLHLCEYVAYDV